MWKEHFVMVAEKKLAKEWQDGKKLKKDNKENAVETSNRRQSFKALLFIHVTSNSKNYFEILHLLIIILT